MSLNKFTNVQKGLDLKLKIGCDELKANIVDFTDVKVDTIDATELTVNDLPIISNNTQSQGISTLNITNTAVETSLFPPSFLGNFEGDFPANTLLVGDTINICLWGRISSSPTGIINIKLYVGDGSYLLASTDPVDVSGSVTNDLYKMEISLVSRSNTVCRVNGIFTVWDATTFASKSHEVKEKNVGLSLVNLNKMHLTAQWTVASAQSTIAVDQYTVSVNSVAPR